MGNRSDITMKIQCDPSDQLITLIIDQGWLGVSACIRRTSRLSLSEKKHVV